MKKLSLDINLEGLKLSEEELKLSKQELVENFIRSLINLGNPKALNEDERYKLGKIWDLLTKAKNENLLEIELEDDWFGFIKRSKRDALFHPNEFTRRVEALIADVKDR